MAGSEASRLFRNDSSWFILSEIYAFNLAQDENSDPIVALILS
jgi:hypothetical protein